MQLTQEFQASRYRQQQKAITRAKAQKDVAAAMHRERVARAHLNKAKMALIPKF